MAYLRISSDSLIMIEIGEGDFHESEKVVLFLEYTDLEITTIGI